MCVYSGEEGDARAPSAAQRGGCLEGSSTSAAACSLCWAAVVSVHMLVVRRSSSGVTLRVTCGEMSFGQWRVLVGRRYERVN